VMSYAVSRRVREIGIRVALGARPGNTVVMVVRQGVILVGAGVAAGQMASLALGHVLARFLYGVSAIDPPTFAGGAIVLCAVALVACVVPARRAMRVDPIVALRHE